jgi:hypothetical protein
MTASEDPGDAHQRTVDAHFSGRISPDDEVRLRSHLPTCARCRRRYQRHLLLARLDPAALPAEQRIARGLGWRRRRRWPSFRAFRPLWLAPGLAVAGVVAVLLGNAGRGLDLPPPAARGSVAAGAAPTLWVYRVSAGGAPRLAAETVVATDELAFAYANPAGKRHLLVFGVDEHRHVYWYHPAWTAGSPPPAPLRAEAAGPHELPDAVRHPLDGQRLDVYALFSDAPVSVETVERAAAAASSFEALAPAGPSQLVRHSFAVSP